MKQAIAVRAFIIHKDKVLIIREAESYKGGANIGKYDLPGGKIKPGEKYSETLIREIREETGLTNITISKPFYFGEWRPKVRKVQWQIIAVFIKCYADKINIQLSKDHDKYQWINPKNYYKYNIISTIVPAFENYLNKT